MFSILDLVKSIVNAPARSVNQARGAVQAVTRQPQGKPIDVTKITPMQYARGLDNPRLRFYSGDQQLNRIDPPYPNILNGLNFGGRTYDASRNPVDMPVFDLRPIVPKLNREGTQLMGRQPNGSYGPIKGPKNVDPGLERRLDKPRKIRYMSI